ncbi:MAG: hypothetical protein J6U54_10790 [Clostridiales bacterium]|nr:hypothetical protein [Clostridiales bacterium]
MRYFICNFSAHFLVTVVLVAITLLFFGRNRARKTKHGFMFLAPLAMSILTVVYVVVLLGPRMMDIKNLALGKYQTHVGYVDSIAPMNNYVVIDGEKYLINPKADMPELGEYVKIKYLDYSGCIMEMEAGPQPVYEEVISE